MTPGTATPSRVPPVRPSLPGAGAYDPRDMLDEGLRIVDAARERGVALRLLGGLAVRVHCDLIAFCERDYSDLDMVGLKAQRKQVITLFRDLGYEFDLHTMQATRGRQLQFVRPCRHEEGGSPVHEDDHVDVFLDTFKMDHEIELKDRLTLDAYTIPVTDQLLTKLQINRASEKDVRDTLTLLKDLKLADEEAPGTIGLRRLAEPCAKDWGLYHDVERSLDRCAAALSDYLLTDEEAARVRDGLARVRAALEAAPKTLAWRVRARVGERRPWYDVVEEQGEER
ncbi:MAG TPA: hypothetical protein VLA35_00740 [Thermoleophilia bacterium]|nr:hypothetical protein [Thermoleophilia bacterium]